jgi:hypothetical protein
MRSQSDLSQSATSAPPRMIEVQEILSPRAWIARHHAQATGRRDTEHACAASLT